jgi:catechol 2,3-dioxygenase-like lactoylglutathione lyase family enzyme
VQQPDRSRFDHIGLITDRERPGERWLEGGRLWVTSPRDHPFNVEWLRFAPDSPVSGPTRTQPHVAYRVDDLAASLAGHEVVLEPTDVGDGFATVAYVDVDGALVEFIQYRDPDEQGWF